MRKNPLPSPLSPESAFEAFTEPWSIAEIDGILNNMRVRSGLKPLTDNPAIVIEESVDAGDLKLGEVIGGYSPMKNRIRLPDPESFINASELLSCLIHERVHARGMNTFRTVAAHRKRTGDVLDPPRLWIGYCDYVSREFEGFNEGVTELIAEEAYDELVKRWGLGASMNREKAKRVVFTRDEVEKRYGAIPEAGTRFEMELQFYEEEKNEVRTLIREFSQRYGVPEETVWNAVKRGYFEGQDLGEIFAAIEEENGCE